jgi:hypothetical protein
MEIWSDISARRIWCRLRLRLRTRQLRGVEGINFQKADYLAAGDFARRFVLDLSQLHEFKPFSS